MITIVLATVGAILSTVSNVPQAVVILSLVVYLIFRTIYPIDERDNTYIALASISAVIACLSFFVAGDITPMKYSMSHSIWHISAYTMLYFALKSITGWRRVNRGLTS